MSERNWGRNPRPSTLSAGEYRLLPGPHGAGRLLSTRRCRYCVRGGSRRGRGGRKRRVVVSLERLPPFLPLCLLPPVVSVLPLQTAALGPLLASASRGPAGPQGRRTGTRPPPGVYYRQNNDVKCPLKTLCGAPPPPPPPPRLPVCLAAGAPGAEAVLLLVDTGRRTHHNTPGTGARGGGRTEMKLPLLATHIPVCFPVCHVLCVCAETL